LTLLSQRGPDGLTPQRATAVISTIKSLIGQFDLDPNRVFDIVLECFELQPENTTFLELIPLFPKSHTTHILGFKFQFYQRSEVEDPVPTGLYRLAATLIKANYIDLDSIYTHLSPTDQEALEQYEEITNKRMDEANKIGKINLAAIGKDLMDDEKPGDVTIDLYAALDMENEAVAERSNELLTNQKLGLLVGALSVGDWYAYLNGLLHLQWVS
jgi:THO complex subunit 2